jgi:hypothetical protein
MDKMKQIIFQKVQEINEKQINKDVNAGDSLDMQQDNLRK